MAKRSNPPQFLEMNRFVRRYAWALFAILAAQVASAASEWGPEQDGVRTSLSTVEPVFSLGKPMVFRLVMENRGERVVNYDRQQVAVNSSMSIEGNDGVSVPFVAMTVQTLGGPRPLNPGERCVLFEALDVADQYLITSPGTYTFRFKGRDKTFGDVAIPPSNTITIQVTDGPLQPSRVIARRLLDAGKASGWRVGIVKEGTVGTTLALNRIERRTKDNSPVLVWITGSTSAEEIPRLGVQRTAQLVGHSPWGEVYLWSGDADGEAWVTARELLVTALTIEEH